MSSLSDHIRERLDGFYENAYESVSNCFLYLYGPHIAMTHGYEKEVDDIAKKNNLMKFLQIGAFILRYPEAHRQLKKSDLIQFYKKLLRVDLPNEFDENTYQREYDALEKLISRQLVNLSRSETESSESVMTNIAPIVPYEGTVTEYGADETRNREHELQLLLIENLEQILTNHELSTYSPDQTRSIHELLLNTADGFDNPVIKYYRLAEINYQNPSKKTLESLMDFYGHLSNFDEEMDESTFEAFIARTIESYTPVIESEWHDLTIDEQDESTVNQMLRDAGVGAKLRDEKPTFDLNALYNFIALNRYIQFDVWSQRLFMDKFNSANKKDIQIINVNRINDNISAYELSTGVLIVPFVDLRDYKVRMIILRRNSNKPFISGEIVYE